MQLKSPRVLVVGAGAIGGVVAAALARGGRPATVLTTNPAIASALRTRGFRLCGEAGKSVPAGPVLERLDGSVAAFDYVVLATQPPQVEEAARGAAAWLRPAGCAVCFQNGLCEERIARIVGEGRVIGAVVAWGASMPEPGVYDRTSAGGFAIGRLDGAVDGRLEDVAGLLRSVGPVSVTPNLRGARWSKLAMNCAVSALGTIGGDRLGPLLRYRAARRLALEIMTEAVAVARAEGVRLEKISGTIDLDWVALVERERGARGSASLLLKHALLLAVGVRYRRLRSSMLAAIERGRPPAVDFLNGEVVSRAEAHGVPAPLNQAVQRLVWAIARGEERACHETLVALYEKTR